ncbi:uncharacterized protein LOC135705185 isoform X2 [Ochlerotatus camptorhynchus]|uniref:uncharacterized protein LOC135705185 isoform X2 n=1 Tax=Ochlerotatus camptorhynchus TaxID=644619 RepID=UPI0031DEAB7F
MSNVSVQKQVPTDGPLEKSAHSVDKKVRKTDGRSAPASSNGDDDITEEEENKLLADDDDDLDVIDCYTEDFDSDMENDFCRREATKEKVRENKASVENSKPCSETEKESKEVEKRSEKMPEEAVNSKEKCSEKTLLDPDDDVIEIDDDISDTFMKPSNGVVDDAKPEISLGVKNEMEKERILREPLVKQIIIPEICVSDVEDDKNSMGSQESLSLQIDHFVEKVSEIMDGIQDKQKAGSRNDSSAAKISPALNSSGETSEVGIYGCHQEDPDVLRLKLDLYQEMGEMDYEQDDKTDEDGDKSIRARVKQEFSSPIKQRPDFSQPEDIFTIELTSTDEDTEPVSQVKVEVPKLKKKRNKKGKKKTSPQSLDLTMVSSEDSFPIVAESTVSERSIESRIRNDSEGSFDDVGERVKSLRNRNVTIIPEILVINSATRKSRANIKFIDKESKEPAKRKKKIDPAMQGYKRRKSVCRSASKSSVLSASTGTSSIPDEDIIVISANDILLTDPNAIEGRIQNIENECDHNEKPTEEATVCQSESGSKEELMNSLALKEAIVKELEHEAPLSDNDPKKEELEENSFPIPTTDIALEDMLDAWIEKEPTGNDPDAVFHSISPEEKFLMDSLFADCEKQSQQLPSQEHLESLNTIMDDGKPLVERSNEEPIALCYTICDGTVQPEVVHMQVDASNTPAVAVESVWDASKIKPPHIKIIQNYHKYPFQNKLPKKQQQVNRNATQRGRRGRKRIVAMGGSDEEYRPSNSRVRKRRVNNKPQQAKLKSKLPKTDFKPTEKLLSKKGDANHEKQVEAQENSKLDVETTSSVCMHMPTLEEDLALTSSDDNSASMVGDKNSGSSEEQLVMPPLKKRSSMRSGKTSKDKAPTNKGHTEPSETCSSKRRGRQMGRKSEKSDSYCPTSERKESSRASFSSQKQSTSEQSFCTLRNEDNNTTKRPVQRRKRRLLTSSSSEEAETTSISNSAITETEPELQLSASSISSETDQVTAQDYAAEGGKDLNDGQQVADTMNNLQIVISPLTEEKIRLINTPLKKPKTFTKASQTEICGMTWSIDLDQIDFHSEYFNKFRTLLNHGAKRTPMREANNERVPTGVPVGCERSFSDVDIPSRSALHHIMNSQSPPVEQPIKPTANGNNRTYTDMLLFHREVSELEHNTSSKSEDPPTRQRLEQVVNTVRSTFRIPKLAKKPSTSPQVVTSSTPHVVDPNCRDDEPALSPVPSTSRSEHNRPAPSAGTVQRLIINDYVDDHVKHSNDRQELKPHIIMQERFVPPVSRNVNPDLNPLAVSIADNRAQAGGQAVSNQVSQPGPSLAVEKKSSIPNRSELFNVKRTIRNDIAQPQALPMLHGLQQPVSQPYVPEACKYNPPQQPTLLSFPMLGGFQPSFAGGNTNSFNRGLLSGYSGMNIPSMFSGGMLGMQGMQHPESNVNNLIAMLWEQCCQQQMNQAAMPPSVASMVPNQNAPSQQPGLGQLFPQMSVPSAGPQFEPQRTNEQLEVISFTFGCIDFLTNKCIRTHCRYSHVVPKEEDVFQKLFIQNRDSIMAAYKFVAIRDDLFNKYFPVFATVMGRNNMRHQLVSTITDCEQPKRPIQYYKYIVEGLKMSGTSPVQAVQIVLDKHTKKNFHQINVLVDLILDTGDGIPTFLRTLEEFSNVKDYRFEIVYINRLLEFCNKVELSSNELAVFISKLVLNVPAGEEHLVSAGALIEFTGKVRLDPELAMNVEYIVRKYGKIEMTP